MVIKGRRPDGTVDSEGYDTDDDSDEEGQEVQMGDKVGGRLRSHVKPDEHVL